jgi:hypothetical protein
MKTPANRPMGRIIKGIVLVWVALAAVAFFVLVSRGPEPASNRSLVAQFKPSPALTNTAALVIAGNTAKTPAKIEGVLPNYPDFQQRPLPVAYESPNIQWTLADGKDTNVIQQLAHNPLEYGRMVEENSRIFRRQLVYLKETAAAVFEAAKLTGKPVQQLTLPGVDGQELQFEIVTSEGNGSSRQGTFSGHLVGNLDSQVSLAFMDGREAYTVLAPKENIYVVGEPREDGQVIVKAIDPNTYGVGPQGEGDDFIKTAGPVHK